MTKTIDIIRHNLPGAILSVCSSGDKIRHYCSGMDDITKNSPMSPDHIFQNGRITRMFTAVIVLKLVEQKILPLDTPLDLLAQKHQLDNGRLRLIVNQYPFLKPITLRALLNHTSGLPAYDETLFYEEIFFAKPKKVWQAETYLDLITGKNVRYRLGYEPPVHGLFGDSTMNYIIVSLVLEAVTGQPVSQQMQAFFTTFQLNHTHYSRYGILDEKLLPQLMHGYLPISHPHAQAFRHLPTLIYNQNRELTVYDVTNAYNFNGLGGSASMSTTTDLIHFIKALVKGKLLTSGIRAMFDVVPVAPAAYQEDQDYYGLGIYKTLTKRYGEIIWNAGNNYGYGVLVAYSVDRDIAFVLAINVSRKKINLHNSLVGEVLEIVLR